VVPRFRANANRGRADAAENKKTPQQQRTEAVERLGAQGLLSNRRFTTDDK
jgi:cytochrome c-type biogenesis protein CcmH/NrfG